MSELTHFDQDGQAHMVRVTEKTDTVREATATGLIVMQPHTLELIRKGEASKGDVIAVARIAAIQATKKTSDLIPLCHPLAITHVAVDFSLEPERSALRCTATVGLTGKTGVEMEALTAVQIGLLTVYDMVKAVDRGMVMTGIQLLEKSGGRSGLWRAKPDKPDKPE
jgi:cyclic pyranopterin phosphate synthase